MQIMPENNLARTAAGTAASASLYADQAGDLFGLYAGLPTSVCRELFICPEPL